MTEKVKKKIKKELIGLLVGIIIGLIIYAGMEITIDKQAQIWKDNTYIGFTNEEKYDNLVQFETLDAVKEKPLEKELYNSRVYYKNLNESEKTVYRLLEYAYSNGFTYVFVEDELFSKCEHSFTDILNFLALDSPVVEQNLVIGEDEATYTFSERFIYKYVSQEVKGTGLQVDNFSAKRTAKKEKAIEAAKKLDLGFSEKTSDLEKARAIYRYLGENIEYNDIKTDNAKKDIMKSNYLYDAFIKGQTNCDGYANAFSLLCNLHGLKAFEKMNQPPEKEIGHTWNAVKIDGKWYNVDATNSQYYSSSDWLKSVDIRFGYSDKAQLDIPVYSELYPQCFDDIIPIEYEFSSPSESGATAKLASAYRNAENGFILVTFKTLNDDDLSDLLSSLANTVYENISSWRLEGEATNIVFIKVD